ncbi:hypothetical protein AcW1_002586 [Taiwanofungus camphoratus]|nr:hypothetical protein AcV5_009733 [Antrodia cinnamomea]KAI0942801.1 hypothetical protein AcV7_002111 [Antrodia cinnamomea]KAI0943420.1 hypothetical protein AcW1_002586 [Antrodia cinnamomea]
MLQNFLGFAFFCSALLSVQATIYVTQPKTGSTCYGGQPCTVSWLDDGEQPLLNEIGPCFVGLYDGNDVLVQQIEPADVSAVHSLQFTPDPNAGPNSGSYYINFTSVNAVGEATQYIQYSPFFTLASMSGSFSSPVPSDTSTIVVPSSILSPSATMSLTTPAGPSTLRSPSASISASSSPAKSGGSSRNSAAPSLSASSSGLITSRVPGSSAFPTSTSTLPSLAPTALTSSAERSARTSTSMKSFFAAVLVFCIALL